MDMTQAFPGATMKATEMLGQVQVLTISAVALEKVGEDTKPVMHFYESQQGLVLNKTKNETLMAAFGPQSEAWIGRQIQLSTGKTQYQGKMVDCIDVSLPGGPAPVQYGVAPPVGAQAAPIAQQQVPGQVPGQPAYGAPVAPAEPVQPGYAPPVQQPGYAPPAGAQQPPAPGAVQPPIQPGPQGYGQPPQQ